MAAKKPKNQLKITQIRSHIGSLPKHRLCLKGLGLRRINHAVVREDNPATRGLIHHIRHMVRVEEGV